MGVEICDSIALGLTAPSHPLDRGHPIQARPMGTDLNVPGRPSGLLMSWEEHGGALGQGDTLPASLPTMEGRKHTALKQVSVCGRF